jgi:voltage-gated potassium channel
MNRKRVHEILEATSPHDRASRLVGALIATLITLSVVVVTLETVETLSAWYGAFFRGFEAAVVAVFTVEYGLRLWACTVDERFAHPIWGRLRFAFTFLPIVDLMAILPFYLPALLPVDLMFLRVLRLLRLARLLKMARYSEAFVCIRNVVKEQKEELLVAFFVIFVLLVFASGGLYLAEHEAQPKAFPNMVAAMWWSLVTLSTVGYGDIYPVTPAGKVIAGGLVLLGVGMFALPASILASGFVHEYQRKRGRRDTCPHCGKELP